MLLLILLIDTRSHVCADEAASVTPAATNFESVGSVAGASVTAHTQRSNRCFDGKQHQDGSMRQARFRCVEHHAHAIENLLLPSEMCCTDAHCVPMFAEHRQRFSIDTLVCTTVDGAQRCEIALACQAAFEAFCKIAAAGVATAALIVLSPFWLQCAGSSRRAARAFRITTQSFYEVDNKTA